MNSQKEYEDNSKQNHGSKAPGYPLIAGILGHEAAPTVTFTPTAAEAQPDERQKYPNQKAKSTYPKDWLLGFGHLGKSPTATTFQYHK